MANTISPNMGLIVPGVGTEPGPDWANDLNADLGVLDQHNHSSGQGVQITPNGININSDFSINSNNLNNVKTVNFSSQLAPLPGLSPNLGCIYVAGAELYYNDEAGNVVAITNMGSVNAGAGSITGLPFGTASASYSPGTQTFIWQSATLTPANMDGGSFIFRNITPSSNGVTLSAPPALASDYQMFWPGALPGSTTFLTLDASGNIGDSTGVYPIDNITLDVAGGLLEVKPQGIDTPQLAVGIAQALNPPGAMTMYGGTSAPAGYLMCDGTAVSRTTYSILYSIIGNAYGFGDGSTTFNVPDMRGVFPRGTDLGRGQDPDSSSRSASGPGGNTGDNVGSAQGSAFQSHIHAEQAQQAVAGGSNFVQLLQGSGGSTVVTNNATSAAGSSSETRPVNVYVNFIIKT